MRRPPVFVRFRVLLPLLLGLVSTPALAAPNALRFNGSTQYVTFGLASSLNASTFTLECWFKREGAGVATSTGAGGTIGVPLIAKGRADADANTRDENYFLGIRSDSVLVADYEEGTGQASPGLNHPIAGVTKIRNDVWYHVAATFNGSRWVIYLNGEIEKDTTLAGARLPQSASIEHASLGTAITSASSSPAAAPAGFFAGVIEEPRIWNVARAQQGIRDSMGLQFATASGLIGRWALDEGTGTTAASTVAGAPSGTLSATSGAVPTWVTGGGPFALPNSASLLLNSNSGYVNFGNPASLKLTQFTLESWIRRDAAGVGTNTGAGGIPNLIPLIAKGRAESEDPLIDINYIFGLRASDFVLCADFEEGAGGDSLSLNHPVTGRTPIGTGVWHHVAVTYDQSRWKLYLDGDVEKDTLIGMPTGSASEVSVSIGSALNSGNTASGFFNGAMDETRIWNRARTQSEIIADMNAEITAARTNLVARWGLNEAAGTAVRGSAGTTVNGTLNPLWSWTASAPFNAVPPSPPNPPTALSVTAQTFASILVSWTDNASNETGYEVLRSTTGIGGSYSVIATLPANSNSYVDPGLSENTEYCYQVRAFNNLGNPSVGPQCTSTPAEGSAALSLAGTNAYADLGKPASLNLDNFTLECWFRRDGTGTGTNTGGTGIGDVVPLISKGRAESEVPERDINYIFGFRQGSGVLCADFEERADGPQPSENHPIEGDAVIANGAWHHAATTYDGNVFRLYLDGNLEREKVVGRPVASSDTIGVALGSALNSAGTAAGFFQGLFDEVRIWNYARSMAEIQSTINTEIETPQTGLVGRWGLNEAAGGTVSGGAGTGINGTIRGTGFSWNTPGAPFDVPAPTLPQAPSSLSATALTEGQIQLAWVDNSSNELVFEIERSTTGPSGTFAPIGTVSANTRTYVDTGLEQVTEYCYQVRASNLVGPSGYTLVKCATTPAEPNKSLDLGGSDSYVAFGDPAALHLPAFTLECWFRRDGAGITATTGTGGVVAAPLVTKGRDEGDNGTFDMNFFLGIRTDGVLVADFEEDRFSTTPGRNHPVIGATPVVDGTWYHAAATYDGSKWQLFLNGNLERELAVGETPQSQSVQRAALGTTLNTSNVPLGYYDGAIDEVRIWNYARTPAQILQTINDQILASQSGLVARWSLNEGTSTLIHGSAGTSIQGTLTGDNWSWIDGAPFDVPAPTAPNAPDQLTANAPNFSEVDLSWVDHASNELAFEIYRSTTGSTGTFTPLDTVPSNTLTYVDTNVNELTQYCYQVRATNSVAPSSFTTAQCASTPVEPSHSIDFGGAANAYVTFGDPDELDLKEFTVEAWFRRDGAGTLRSTGSNGFNCIPIVTHGTAETDDSNVDMNFHLGIDNDTNVIGADLEEGAEGADPGNNHPVLGHTTIVNGVWYHAAVAYDGTRWRLYLNGELETEEFVGQLPRWNTIQPAALATGIQSDNTPQGFFDGRIDEVRIWDHERTEAEIQSTINTQIKTAQPGLVARWGLNEGIGTTVSGSAGTAITGTITGSDWAWVDPAPFNIVIQHAPGQPDQPSPADEATHVSTSPTLSVHVTDPDPGNLTVTFYGRAVAGAAGPDFSLLILPDTQFYTSSKNGGTPAMFDAQTSWVMNNRVARNIVDLVQVGDCTDDGDSFEVEWQNADNSLSTIETPFTGFPNGLPYSVCVGNHDQSPNGDAAGTTNFYNQYFGSARFQGRGYYGGHFGSNNDNHYHLFSASGMNFIVISMEYDPQPDVPVLAWCGGLLRQFSNRRAIIASHSIIGAGNPATFSSQGQAIYDTVKAYPNVFMMVCGHVSPPEGRRTDTFNGHTIQTIMTDYQGRTRGGDGWLRIYEFSPANNVIRARTYSPTLDQFETDADSSSQFTLPYDMGGGAPYQVVATRTNVVPGSVVSAPWSNLNAAAQYDWYVTVSDGARTTNSDVFRFTTNDVVNPTVQVTVPNGGESWATGSHHNITWTASDNNRVDSVRIEVSTNGGANYATIASGLPHTGTYDWLVPSTPVGNQNRIRVSAWDPTLNVGSDVSNANFTITDGDRPTVALTAPDGGESWPTGSSQTITWSSGDNVAVTSVDLAYSTNGGTSFPNVIATAIPSTGSRSWTVPNTPGTTVRVRIIARDAAGNTARDSSAANFTIVDQTPPVVTLTAPNGGESWGAGSSHNITWIATDNVAVTAIDLKYSTDGGATFPNAIATGITNSGTFAWTVPGSVGTNTRVMVTARDAATQSASDSSNTSFAITPEGVPPVVTVTAPNTAVTWATGTHHNITWTATDNASVQSVDIALSTNGGTSYPNVIATGLTNSGTFDWLVASNVANNTNRIQVTARDPSGNVGSDVSNVNFTITDGSAPVVNVSAPDGGETWGIGTSQTITWSATDNVAVTTVDLAYSTNGGSTFPNVIATGIANTGSRAWTIPNTASTTARVRVIARDAAGNTARDSSALNFTIADVTPPVVSLTAPNGGESWAAATSHNITWTATDNVAVTAVDLKYSTDGGATYPNAIATGITNSGTFAWTVPNAVGNTVRVSVTARDAAAQSGSDSSAANFAITPEGVAPVVTVTAPNTAVSWATGTHHDITWTATDNTSVQSVDIDLSTNGGTSYPSNIATDIANAGTFDWLVASSVIGATNRIRVTAHDPYNNTANDVSNVNFTITDGSAPAVALTIPDGGEVWSIGSSQTITWSASDNVAVASVDLAYSTNGGTSFPNVIASAIANSGSRAWTIPNTPSTTVRVRIIARDAAGNTARDSSSLNFTIVDDVAPVASLTSPNGGESWAGGSVHAITWTATDNVAVTGVDLRYSTDGGANYSTTIATNIANSGSFNWTVPGTLGTAYRIQVVARDAASQTGSDNSDANFSVVPEAVPPNVTVSSPNGGESWATGSHHDITWSATDASGVPSVDLAYSTNGGATYPNAIATAVANAGTFDWLVPSNAAGATFRVRVTAVDGNGNTGNDASNANFTVTDGQAPTASLTAPDGGESFDVGSSQTITWNATDNIAVATVDLAYSTNGGASFPNVIATGIANTGSRSWTIPATPSSTVRVRVIARDAAGNTARDSSSANFSIVDNAAPLVTLNAPNGGENWGRGSAQSITWSASDNVGVTGIDLAYSTDGGANYPNAIASNIANTGSFAWTVPNDPNNTMRVRVTARDAASHATSDASNGNFSIIVDPDLVANGGFETNINGWINYSSATLSQGNEGHTGTHCLQIVGSSSFGCDDSPDNVPATGAVGAIYRISCWVRSPNSSGGQLKIRVYEYVGSSQQGSTAYSNQPNASTAWQLLTLDYTVRSANSYLSIRITGSSSGTFLVDDVSIKRLSGPQPNAPPVVVSPANVNATAGSPLSFQVTASDADGPALTSLTQTGKPAAATFSAPSPFTVGTFNWTPTAADVRTAPYVVIFTASNTQSGRDTTNIVVGPAVDRPPVVTAPANVTGSAGFPLSFSVTANDPDGQTFTFGQSGKPAAATFTVNSATSATFSWTPTAADVSATPYEVTFTATNAAQGSALTRITVGTAPPNLVGNPDFESGTNGWGTYGGATLATVAGGGSPPPGGPSGNALRVTGSSSFGADDDPNCLPGPLRQGAVYRISCWVRSATGATGDAKIRVYEYIGTSQQGSTAYSQILPLSPNWQQLTVDYTVRVQNSYLSIRITDAPSSGTEVFLIDNVSIVQLSQGALVAAQLEAPVTPKVEALPVTFAAWFAPNPMQAAGTLTFTTTRAGFAKVEVFDVHGRVVRGLLDERSLDAGTHRLAMDARGLRGGLYFYRIQAGEGRIQGRFVLTR
jgi:hypothetical protein